MLELELDTFGVGFVERASPSEAPMGRDPTRHGYRKGDNKAGGGGRSGGGGKRGRAPHGWEKGDNLRDFSEVRDDVELPEKPGSPHHHREEPVPTPGTPRSEQTIMRWLRATNAALLTTMRKLEGTGVGDAQRRGALVQIASQQVARKHDAEASLFPLMMDHPEVRDDLLASRELAAAIDEALSLMAHTDPADREFSLAVRVLHGILDQQIQLEHDALLPVAERVIPLDQARELASSLRSP